MSFLSCECLCMYLPHFSQVLLSFCDSPLSWKEVRLFASGQFRLVAHWVISVVVTTCLTSSSVSIANSAVSSDSSIMLLVSFSPAKLFLLVVVIDGVVLLSMYSLSVLCSFLLLHDCNRPEFLSGVFITITLILGVC